MAEKVYDFMVDLETLGVQRDALILSIGVIKFNPEDYDPEKAVFEDYFYRVVERRADAGSIDLGTIEWWMRQPDEARLELFGGDIGTSPLEDVFDDLADFFRPYDLGMLPKECRLWAKNYPFDRDILRQHLEECNYNVPWRYNQWDEVGTLQRRLPRSLLGSMANTQAHNALEDCKYQVHVVQTFNHLWRKLNVLDN